MGTAALRTRDAAFDVVGKYNQDQINGFPESLIERMLEIVDPFTGAKIIELMGGDGNLSSRLVKYCARRGITLKNLSMLEYSRVQAEFAKMELADSNAEVIWGDVLSMRSLADEKVLPTEMYDRVMIKSANHEIRVDLQELLYRNIFELLQPDGLFVNLGFLFDNAAERDELRMIARTKDTLAGMTSAVANRHFLTREEFYQHLKNAGFVDIRSGESFSYAISSRIVSGQYFSGAKQDQFDLEFQACQARARNMRRRGWITFDQDHSLMRGPGEITVARKANSLEVNTRIFKQYPYDFVRSIEVHRRLLSDTVSALPKRGRILDLGCGLGLLAERLGTAPVDYEGVDLSTEFINICKERFAGLSRFSFTHGDVNTVELGSDRYQAITLLNVLYISGVKPRALLEKVFDALESGGTLVVSGPTSIESFRRAEPQIIQQLERDGLTDGHESEIKAIRKANDELLGQRSNYWSVEGMSELLRMLGFEIAKADPSHYYGNAYLVVARKP